MAAFEVPLPRIRPVRPADTPPAPPIPRPRPALSSDSGSQNLFDPSTDGHSVGVEPFEPLPPDAKSGPQPFDPATDGHPVDQRPSPMVAGRPAAPVARETPLVSAAPTMVAGGDNPMVSQAPQPAGSVRPMGPLAAPPTHEPGKGPFVDNPVTRIVGAAFDAAGEAAQTTNEEEGTPSDVAEKFLQATGMGAYSFGDALLRPTITLLDAARRGLGSAFEGGTAAIYQSAVEFGKAAGMSDADAGRFGRDFGLEFQRHAVEDQMARSYDPALHGPEIMRQAEPALQPGQGVDYGTDTGAFLKEANKGRLTPDQARGAATNRMAEEYVTKRLPPPEGPFGQPTPEPAPPPEVSPPPVAEGETPIGKTPASSGGNEAGVSGTEPPLDAQAPTPETGDGGRPPVSQGQEYAPPEKVPPNQGIISLPSETAQTGRPRPSAAPPAVIAMPPPKPLVDQAGNPTPEAIQQVKDILGGAGPSGAASTIDDIAKGISDVFNPAEDGSLVGTRDQPAKVETPEELANATAHTAEPTPAQAAAQNYRHAHIDVHGIRVMVETPKGATRRSKEGVNPPWEVPNMPAAYGYIPKSVGSKDGKLDVFIGDKLNSKKVFVIDQRSLATGRMDEHKAVMGAANEAEARGIYTNSFSDGHGAERIMGVTPMSVGAFKKWSKSYDPTVPLSRQAPEKAVAPVASPPEVEPKAKKAVARKRHWYKAGTVPNLIQFLGHHGGVQDITGELKALDLHKRYPGFVSGKGMHPDKARELAAEAGYFGADTAHAMGNTSVADLYDALADGEHIYPQTRVEAEQRAEEVHATAAEKDAERHNSAVSEVENYLRENGIPDDDRAFKDRVAGIMVNRGVSAEKATDIATSELDNEELSPAAIKTRDSDLPPGWDDDTNVTDEERPPFSGDEERENGAGSAVRAGQGSAEAERRPTPQGGEAEGPVRTETGADNRPQGVIPGAEKIGQGELAKRKAAEALKPKAPQKPADEGLFGDESKQTDLIDALRQPPKKAEASKPDTGPAAIVERIISQDFDPIERRKVATGQEYGGKIPMGLLPAIRAAAEIETTYERLSRLSSLIGDMQQGDYHPHAGGKGKKAKAEHEANVAAWEARRKPQEEIQGIVNQKRGDLIRAAMKEADIQSGDNVLYTEGAIDGRNNKPVTVEGPFNMSGNIAAVHSNGGMLFVTPDDILNRVEKVSPKVARPQLNPRAETPPAPKDEFDDIWNSVASERYGKPAAAPSVDAVAKGISDILGGFKAPEDSFVDPAKYEKLKPFFRDGLKMFAAPDADLRTMVRGLYNALADSPSMNRDAMEAMKPYIRQFVDDVVSGKESLNVSGTRSGVEPGGGRAAAPNDVGATGVPPAAGGNDAGAPAGGGAGKGGSRGFIGGGGSVPSGYAPAVGADGDLELPARPPGPNAGARPDPFEPIGSGGTRQPGLFDDPGAKDEAAKAAGQRTDVNERRRLQVAAEKADLRYDRASIEEMLPMLMPAQRDDVFKAEQRYGLIPKTSNSEPIETGHGFLLTNGTGTGKTYSGLGVIKRMTKAGKGQILVLAPSQGVIEQWKTRSRDVLLDMHVLDGINDAGRPGLNATTYANLYQNNGLVNRDWHMLVADEAHLLSSNAAGAPARWLNTFRALTLHPAGMTERARMAFPAEWAEVEKHNTPNGDPSKHRRAWEAFEAKAKPAIERWKQQARPPALFLSASPFAYHFSLDYGEGYLFDYPPDTNGGYNHASGRNEWYVRNLGYRMKTGKLTKPEADVNLDIMERQVHETMKKTGALSGRQLQLEHDYDRKFVLVDDAIGKQIDQALSFLQEADKGRFRDIYGMVAKKFEYLSRMRLLEAMKARAAIPYIRDSIDRLNRKVVVFHNYNEGGGFSPFELEIDPGAVAYIDGKMQKLKPLYDEFLARNPYVAKLDFAGYLAPIYELQKAFPDALVYNGTVSTKKRSEAKRLFNDNQSGHNLIIVQSAAGEFGVDFHDTVGDRQRVLLNLGMPIRPVSAIQQEGRIYREGVMSDAIYRYMNTGTNWERWTYAGKIAERAGTAENLAMGNVARQMRQAFIDAFEGADDYPPEAGEGKGGKVADRGMYDAISEFERAKTHYFAQQKKTARNKAQEGVDYFATPEPLGLKMVEWAGIRPGEKILEPSAGHGAISRYFPETTARTIVEPSPDLASRAALSTAGARTVVDRFENLDVGANKFHAIVMNPPFGHGGATAVNHISKAASHLVNGGRIVAIISRGPAADKAIEKLLDTIGENKPQAQGYATNVFKIGDFTLPAATFERAGTSVATRVIILEKQSDPSVRARLQDKTRDWSDAETINDFFDRIEDVEMPERLQPITREVMPTEQGETEIEVAGVRFKLIDVAGLANGTGAIIAAKPIGHLGDNYKQIADAARAAGGGYLKGTGRFEFPSAEARQDFFTRVANPETAGKEPPKAGAPVNGVTFGLGDTIHGKTGKKVFVATIKDRVEREVYDKVNAAAKKYGGYYSAYTGRGAIPGFQFSSEAARKSFVDEVSGVNPPSLAESSDGFAAPPPISTQIGPGLDARQSVVEERAIRGGGRFDLGSFPWKPGVPRGQQMQIYVREMGTRDGVEYMVAVDGQGTELGHQHGTRSSTGRFRPEMEAAMRDPNGNVVAHHNHPRNTSFSLPDVQHLAFPGLRALWAHGSHGFVGRVALSDAFRDRAQSVGDTARWNFLSTVYKWADDKIFKVLNEATRGKVITVDQAYRVHSHLINTVLRDAGILDYRSSYDDDPGPVDEVKKLAVITNIFLNGLADHLRNGVNDIGRAAGYAEITGADRRTEPLRHVGDLGATFGRARTDAIESVAQRPDAAGTGHGRAKARRSEQLRLPGIEEGDQSEFFGRLAQNPLPELRRDLPPTDVESLKNDLQAMVSRIAGKRVPVVFEPTIPADWGDTPPEDRYNLGAQTFGGYIEWNGVPGQSLIVLATEGRGLDPRTAAAHESWHHIERWLLTDAERSSIDADLAKGDRSTLRRYAADEVGGMDQARELPDIEVTAFAFERYERIHRDGADWHPDQGGGGILLAARRFFTRLMELFRQIRAMLRRKDLKVEKIFEKAARGDYGKTDVGKPYDRFEFSPTLSERASLEEADANPGFAAPPNPFSTISRAAQAMGLPPGGGPAGAFAGQMLGPLDRARIQLQDRYLAWRREIEAIEAATGAGELPSDVHVYRAMRLFVGRAGERLVNLRERFVQPLVDDMRAAGISIDEIGDFLYATHALRRNAVIRGRDPSNDAGSGMTDAQARNIISNVMADSRSADFRRLAQRVWNMNHATREYLVDEGLLSRDQADAWNATMGDYYVPLRGFDDTDPDAMPDGPRVGRGFDVRGKEAQTALGRESKADNPLVYSIMQAAQAIVRAEKNRVNMILLRFVRTYPNPDLYTVYHGRQVKWLDPTTGLVRSRWEPAHIAANRPPDRETTFAAKRGGKPVYVQIHDTTPMGRAMARALRGTGNEAWNNAAIQTAFTLARTFAFLQTQANIDFVLPNVARDTETALLMAADIEGKPRGMRRAMLKRLPKGVYEIWKALGDPARQTEYARYFEEFRVGGGKISALQWNDANQIRRQLARLHGRSRTAAGLFRGFHRIVMDTNTAAENGIRLSTYIALREAGHDQAKAAFEARHLTVDFNLHGELGPILNALWVFWNAGTQGTFRILGALRRRKSVRWFFVGAFLYGMLQNYVNSLTSDRDDNDDPRSDAVPDYEVQRNLIFMLPGNKHGAYVKWPVAWGLNFPVYAGDRLMALIRGAAKPADVASGLLHSVLNTFNPWGDTPSLTQMVAPTFVDPVVQIKENENFFGGPIYPEKHNKLTPDSELAWPSTSPMLKDFTRWMNRESGGNVGRAGWLDFSPETIKTWTSFLGGGSLASILRAFNTGENIATGNEVDPNQIPVVRRFFGTTENKYAKTQAFYDAWDQVDAAHYEVQQLTKAKQFDEAKAARDKYAKELQAYTVMNHIKTKDLPRIRADRYAAEAAHDQGAIDKADKDLADVLERARKAYPLH